jgi:hypothetical protein
MTDTSMSHASLAARSTSSSKPLMFTSKDGLRWKHFVPRVSAAALQNKYVTRRDVSRCCAERTHELWQGNPQKRAGKAKLTHVIGFECL